MSFQEELEKILRSEFYVNEHDNCDDSCSKKWHSDEAYKRAITSIINLVDKELPKDIDYKEINIPEGEPATVTILRMDAYNEAIRDMRNKLRGE